MEGKNYLKCMREPCTNQANPPNYIFPPEIFYSESSAIGFCVGIMQQFDFQSKFLLALNVLKSEFLITYKISDGTLQEAHYVSGHSTQHFFPINSNNRLSFVVEI